MMRRCFVCAADMIGPSDRHLTYPNGRTRTFPLACGSCGTLLTEDADPAICRDHLAARLAAPVALPDPDASYGLDIYSLRSAATRFGCGIRPVDEEGRAELLNPHGMRAAQGQVFRLAGEAEHPVSLGFLCRRAELDTVLAGLADHANWSDDVAILVDGVTAEPCPVAVSGFAPGTVRVAARPLDGDFGAQRNALQGLARHDWMLQLDADETIAPETGRLLPALAAMADEADGVSIGLSRANRVDGMLSDVYPDVQYRLNRTHVAYRGRVHERPRLSGGWPRSFIALHGEIAHTLSRAHVQARSRRYEALDPGRGRLEEEAALLTPFRD